MQEKWNRISGLVPVFFRGINNTMYSGL